MNKIALKLNNLEQRKVCYIEKHEGLKIREKIVKQTTLIETKAIS